MPLKRIASIVRLYTSFVSHIKIHVLWICFKIKEKDAVLTMGDSATSLLSLPFFFLSHF